MNEEHQSRGKFQCDDCNKGFYTKLFLQNHIERVHLKVHKCLFCEENFVNKESLCNHLTDCKIAISSKPCFLKQIEDKPRLSQNFGNFRSTSNNKRSEVSKQDTDKTSNLRIKLKKCVYIGNHYVLLTLLH